MEFGYEDTHTTIASDATEHALEQGRREFVNFASSQPPTAPTAEQSAVGSAPCTKAAKPLKCGSDRFPWDPPMCAVFSRPTYDSYLHMGHLVNP